MKASDAETMPHVSMMRAIHFAAENRAATSAPGTSKMR